MEYSVFSRHIIKRRQFTKTSNVVPKLRQSFNWVLQFTFIFNSILQVPIIFNWVPLLLCKFNGVLKLIRPYNLVANLLKHSIKSSSLLKLLQSSKESWNSCLNSTVLKLFNEEQFSLPIYWYIQYSPSTFLKLPYFELLFGYN